MTEPLSIDGAAVASVIDALSGVAGRLSGCVPVRAFPSLAEPAARVVDAGWRFDAAVEGAVVAAGEQCRVAAVLLRVLASDVQQADRWSGL